MDAIAQTPVEPRDAARLLVLPKGGGAIQHRRFFELPDLLEAGDLLILNNTRVTAIRLLGHKSTGGAVEVLLLGTSEDPGRYRALVRPGKRLKPGTRLIFERCEATVEGELDGGERLIAFEAAPDLGERIAKSGRTPLPPYIHEHLENPERYQTIFAQQPGSAAAPTAGLHFTPKVFDHLRDRGVEIGYVSLEIGIDTFRPIQSDDLSQHAMHGEVCSLDTDTADLVNQCRGRIIAVGTTTVRTLETLATGPRSVEAGQRTTRIFIRPPYECRVVDGLITNFHLPKTSMLMMAASISGREQLLGAYAEALRLSYRFLSFGDAMLIL